MTETILVTTPLKVRFLIWKDPSGLFVGHGAVRDIWASASRTKQASMPRHRLIAPGTVYAVCTQLRALCGEARAEGGWVGSRCSSRPRDEKTLDAHAEEIARMVHNAAGTIHHRDHVEIVVRERRLRLRRRVARAERELKLQALRIGEVGITAIPGEIFGISGPRIKAQSPLTPTFNVELTNGAAGYFRHRSNMRSAGTRPGRPAPRVWR